MVPILLGLALMAPSPTAIEKAISNAFQTRPSAIQMGGEGVVDRVLSGDTDGSGQQRFIPRPASGLTLLIAHDIDIAPAIDTLRIGDRIAFDAACESPPPACAPATGAPRLEPQSGSLGWKSVAGGV